MKHIVMLTNSQAREFAKRLVDAAPDGYRLEIRENTRSLAQNDALHDAIREWGASIGWTFGGQTVDLEDLKVIAVSGYRKQARQGGRVIVGIEGEPVDLGLKTSRLTRAEASELIEMIRAMAA